MARYDDMVEAENERRTAEIIDKVAPLYENFGTLAPNRLPREPWRVYATNAILELERRNPASRQTPVQVLRGLTDKGFLAYFDATVEAVRPVADSYAAPGTLREVRKPQRGGGEFIEFVGDEFVAWSPFMRPGTAINKFKIARPWPRSSVGPAR
jgi:hypothetical protein